MNSHTREICALERWGPDSKMEVQKPPWAAERRAEYQRAWVLHHVTVDTGLRPCDGQPSRLMIMNVLVAGGSGSSGRVGTAIEAGIGNVDMAEGEKRSRRLLRVEMGVPARRVRRTRGSS